MIDNFGSTLIGTKIYMIYMANLSENNFFLKLRGFFMILYKICEFS